MYSLTRVSIARQLARMQIGISAVVRITNGSEMPSTPMRYVMVPASHGRFSTNWNSAENGSKRHAERDQRHPQRDPAGVALHRGVLAAHHHDEERADERQERGDGEDRPAH